MSNQTPTNEANELSPAKILANLLNAQLSTGPKTEAGKAKSKMNALRHGLTGQFYVMNEPDRLAFNAFEKEMLEDLAPVGATERQLAITLAQNNWRLNRARAIESNIEGLGHYDYALEIDADTAETEAAVTQAKTWLNHHHSLTNLTLYENRIERMIARTEKRLECLQANRKAAEAQALEEAELLVCQSLMQRDTKSGLIPTAAVQSDKIEIRGFVFSASKIITGLSRKTALATARFYKANNWDTSKPVPKALTMPPTMPKAA